MNHLTFEYFFKGKISIEMHVTPNVSCLFFSFIYIGFQKIQSTHMFADWLEFASAFLTFL